MITARRKVILMFTLAILITGLIAPMVFASELTDTLPEAIDFEHSANRVILITRIIFAVLWAIWAVYAGWGALSYLAAATNPEKRSSGKEILGKVFISALILGCLTVIARVAVGVGQFIEG